jgi:Ca-activated chloride channel family protein
MWRGLCALCLVLSLSLLSAQDALREDLQVTLVSLYVSAIDEKGNHVSGLTPADFLLLENGEVQTINSFSAGGDDISLTVAFLIDNSGSITASDLDMARSAGLMLLREMQSTDKFLLMTFRHDAKSLVEPTFDKTQIENTLRSIRPQYGNTSLYDAIYLAAGKLDYELGRRVLLLFSDGQDNSSRRRLNDLLTGVVALSDITVISIGTPFHQEAASRYGAFEEHKKGRNALEQLAQTTGGFSVFPENKAAVVKTVLELRNWIRNQYTLGYYPSNRKRDGSWREIQLQCKRKGVRLAYRKGYFAPDSVDAIQTDHSSTNSVEENESSQEHLP